MKIEQKVLVRSTRINQKIKISTEYLFFSGVFWGLVILIFRSLANQKCKTFFKQKHLKFQLKNKFKINSVSTKRTIGVKHNQTIFDSSKTLVYDGHWTSDNPVNSKHFVHLHRCRSLFKKTFHSAEAKNESSPTAKGIDRFLLGGGKQWLAAFPSIEHRKSTETALNASGTHT